MGLIVVMFADPNTCSNFGEVLTTNIELDWTVDFNEKRIYGDIILSMKRIAKDVQEVVLDASHLDITAVQVDGQEAEYSLGPFKFGGRLVIAPDQHFQETFKVRVSYSTTAECQALQWLNPEQTSGKALPFLFSQCQAILARSLLPCQDTPSAKAPYTAKVRIKEPYSGLTVVMSANEFRKEGEVFYFGQTMPIPSYLIAIGVGDLACQSFSPRSCIWAEPSVLPACVYEFGETERFIAELEALLGPYRWQVYNMLVLPPSFPYGGMENPCLTFLTPSLLAGDRSLVSVLVHEITHSWTGNLVTNSSWEHFWLNEGFTKYIERKVIGRIYGEPLRDLLSMLGLADLQTAVNNFGPTSNLSCLVPDLSLLSPDDTYSIIPYEKGHAFLYYLEKTVGDAELFDRYLRDYIQHFAQRPSLNTEEWRAFTVDHFSETGKLSGVDFDQWLYTPGMPPVQVEHNQELMTSVQAMVESWKSGSWSKASDSWESFSSQQKSMKLHNDTFLKICVVLFLDMLDKETKGALAHDVLKALDETYSLSPTHNVEIALKWFLLCLHSRYAPAYDGAARFATLHGRMKYCRPVLRELYLIPEAKQLALDTFQRHRSFYHPQAERMIAKDLGLA